MTLNLVSTQMWREHELREKIKKLTLRTTFVLLLLVISLSLFNEYIPNIGTVSAQGTNGHIVEINDRFVVLNWTVQENLSYNSFRIEIDDKSLNETYTWSIIQINQSTLNLFHEVNPVNYSEANGNIYPSQKEIALNFTYFLIPENVTFVQAKVNGLKTFSPYQISIFSSNISIIESEGSRILQINEEEISWVTEEFITLQSVEEALEYSRTATTITILVIVTVFVIIFIVIARIDVPFNRIAYVFIFPALFALILLEIYPILYGLVLSFTSYNLRRGEVPQVNWLENYVQISNNPQLPIAFTTSLVWSTIIIFLKIFLGFVLAYIIHYKVKRKKIWYLLIYLPWAIPSYIKILSWRTFIQGSGGDSLFNLLLGTNVNLMNQPYVALLLACFVEVWDSIPLITTLFLGGLRSIPKELNDIAKVDQISERTSIRKIVIPLIKPIILPAIILEIIKTFGSFNVAFLFTSGYPLLPYGASEAGIIGATDLFSTFTFYMFYQRRDVGIAAAYSTIMSLLTLFFVLIWMKMSKGTQSSFRPEGTKQKSRGKIVLPSLLMIQALGYILSSIFEFRYFGHYWNPVLSYIMAAFYLVLAILFIVKPHNSITILKLFLLLDLILSITQFFQFQMWFALNWSIFIIAIEFFLLTNFSKNNIASNKVHNKVKEFIQNVKKVFEKMLQTIDSKLTNLNLSHLLLLLQIIALFISNFIVENTSWFMWGIFGLSVLTLMISAFSSIVSKLVVLIQPIIWIGMGFGWNPIGWKIIHVFLSIIFLINYVKVYSNSSSNKINQKMQSILTQPINSSIILFSISMIAFIPMWNILWIAFSPTNTVVPTNLFPTKPTLSNFSRLFTEENILLHFGNSLIIALGSATLCILLTVLAAYAFSRYNFKAKKELMVGVFILKMFTGILTLIPFYLIMFNLGLIDSYLGVILAYSTHTIPLGLWLIKGYMDSIPKELDESALLMGNSVLRVLRKIIIPLAGPVIAIAFLLNFLAAWNGFLLAFVLLQSPLKYTLPIKLYTFIGSIETSSPEWGMFAAASLLVIIPLLIIFIFLRNYLLQGIDGTIEGGDV
ncbi:MAG: ABC transporter permease subunit [Candidatus Heimdallarchaeota archaeon]|nr:ABC transporter permease subunit [Candidatus Heimdallarchaeota archaeon]